VRRIWGEVKAAEKKQKGEHDAGLLDSVPRALPALVEAQQITTRAAHVGFDWDNPNRCWKSCTKSWPNSTPRGAAAQEELEGELGDMLFVLVNLARFVKVDPEQALRKTNAKFRRVSDTSSASWASGANRRRPPRWPRWTRSGRSPSDDRAAGVDGEPPVSGSGRAAETHLGIQRHRTAAGAAVRGGHQGRRAGVRRL
jgi:hypothetical protein